jgi:ribosomal protein S18 acetylase RimI-like enzyme
MNKPGSCEVSGTIPAESYIERLSGDVGLPVTNILSLLKAAFGGDDTPPWPANQRWLLWSPDKLLGHVSVQRRWFVVNKHYFEGWHVGGVCVDPAVQRSGIGTLLMRQVHADLSLQELDFAVLNCGRPLVRFYNKVGYTKVSDRALYMRDGRLVSEEDPALAISFRQTFDVAALTCESFPFGFDF